MKTSTLHHLLPALALLAAALELPAAAQPAGRERARQSQVRQQANARPQSQAQPARSRTSPARTAGRAAGQASQRSTAPALLGGRMYDQNGVNFSRLIREDDFARRNLQPNQTAIQRRGQPGDMSVPREGRHIQYTGRTSGYVTGPDGRRYVIAQFRDLSNPAISANSGSEHRWSAGGVQFSQRIAHGDQHSYAEGVNRGWQFLYSRPIADGARLQAPNYPAPSARNVTASAKTTQSATQRATTKTNSAGSRAGAVASASSSSAHQSGGLIMDPPN